MTTASTVPYSLEAEENLLGAMMLSAEAVEDARDYLKPSDFHVPKHQAIFEAITTLYDRNDPTDQLFVCRELESKQRLADAGGKEKIEELSGYGGDQIENAAALAKVIHDDSIARAVLTFARKATATASTGRLSAEELQAFIESGLTEAMKGMKESKSFTLADGIKAVGDRMRKAEEQGSALRGVESGFTELDEKTNGFEPGDLIVVGARPGVGKSLFVQHIAEYAAVAGVHTMFFSLEMSYVQLTMRSISRYTAMPMDLVQRCLFTNEGKARLKPYKTDYEPTIGNRLTIVEASGSSLHKIKADATRRKRQLQTQGEDLGLVIVDYLGLIQPAAQEKFENSQARVAAISNGLKQLAVDLNVPVIAACQLNRESTVGGKASEPTLSQLRDSGAIEQDASVVLLLHQPSATDPDDYNIDALKVLIRKNRMGEGGHVDLITDYKHQTIHDPPSAAVETTAPTLAATGTHDLVPF